MPGHGWTHRLRLILISALQVDKAVLFSALITVAGFVPLFTMQASRVRFSDPWPAPTVTRSQGLDRDLHGHSRDRVVLAPGASEEVETIVVRTLHRLYDPALRLR